MESQNKIITELLKATQAAPSTKRSISSTLRIFNPEVADTEAETWQHTASIILREHPLEGAALVMILSKASKKSID